MSDPGVVAHFLDGRRGRILALMHRPHGAAGGRCVLVVPPFAEEMNKSRSMLADVARGLAVRGVATVIVDLFGTGDSEGEFHEADWEVWKHDLARAAAWSAGEGWPTSALLCVRLGCLLGAQAVQEETLGRLRCAVFWQPVVDGQRFMIQFLRLRVAASMMESSGRESVTELMARLRQGDTLEIAGYELSSTLAQQIERLRLPETLTERLGQVHWFELVRDTPSTQPASGEGGVEKHSIVGEPFWSSTEIVRIPALTDRSVEILAACA